MGRKEENAIILYISLSIKPIGSIKNGKIKEIIIDITPHVKKNVTKGEIINEDKIPPGITFPKKEIQIGADVI